MVRPYLTFDIGSLELTKHKVIEFGGPSTG